jgi:site-specific recombinase XerC
LSNDTRQPLDCPLSADMSRRIDVYRDKFRRRIPGAIKHAGIWPSNLGRPMDGGTIYDMVRRGTRTTLGFPINLHRFRPAAATFWSINNSTNVRGVKDLLGVTCVIGSHVTRT